MPNIPVRRAALGLTALVLAGCAAAVGEPAQTLAERAPPVEADWESLNARGVPEWWQDAKLGIFIHWGVYAVPAYAPVGEYAEWYGESMNPVPSSDYIAEHHAKLRATTRARHIERYGADFDYADFAPLWKAEHYDPEDWARLFAEAGAGYVVLTSKHHDGFALWPSAEASESWGRPWNAVEVGPGRDVLGELMTAVRGQGMRAGLYYSLYEWYNPTYTNDKADRATITAYVANHFQPQIRDLVTRYDPDILWGDGSWDHPSSTWQTPELMAWAIQTQPNGADIVYNDRWGDELRGKAGVLTSEYGAGRDTTSPPWEENRGMGRSYGYNAQEGPDDYATAEEIVLTLVDVVSRGGNLLLNVGPKADGTIPDIQAERLRHLGRWMETYGEGIRGTRSFRSGVQWSEGARPDVDDAQFKADYDILRLAQTPRPGEARKAVMFTRSGDTLHAFATRAPEGELRLRNVTLAPSAEVRWLGLDEAPLSWRQDGGDVVVSVPPMSEARTRLGAPFGIRLAGGASAP